eukprot:TRINITY_DN45156_c0_g1_i1.p1 TRINITY_DN45156_c0_g1~~TRINITY_DN45156_c0_g1_i1.p1  ORF type:complete len:364 (-),score=48.00 TRINITY_DN45156_c0_g1_i1:139-1230(-)
MEICLPRWFAHLHIFRVFFLGVIAIAFLDVATADRLDLDTVPGDADVDNFRLLVVIRSRYAHLESRIQPSLDTWIPLLGPNDRVLTFVSSRAPMENQSSFPDAVHLIPVDCAEGHDLVCVAAEYHRVVLPMMHKYDAMHIIDDDVYLNPRPFKQVLMQQIAAAPKGVVAFGIPGCGIPWPEPPTVVGWCGGGGFGLSQNAAMKLLKTPVSGPPTDGGGPEGPLVGVLRQHVGPRTKADGFVNLLLTQTQTSFALPLVKYVPEDVIVGSTWRSRAIDLVLLNGLYAWPLEEPQLVNALETCDPVPLLFHYADRKLKTRIHESLKHHKDCKLQLLQSSQLDAAYLEDLRAYIASNGRVQTGGPLY